MSLKTIAVVEDDVSVGDMLEETLRREGYRVLRAYSGTEALLLFSRERPDLVLLDLMLPGLSGEQVLPELRGVPVIVLSARGDVEDKVRLLLGGAADYLTKPFDSRELLARIAVRLAETASASAEDCIRFDDLELYPASRQASAAGKPVRLTKTEYAVLKLLLRNARQVVTKSQILEFVSEDTPDCVESSLKVHVSNLRGKLKAASGKDYIEAVWGIGFKMREE